MDIQYAILGILSWQSLSGYDIKKVISDSDVFYWSGNNNQIYNNLIALHKNGLVTQEIIYQESLPAKKIYSITETGQQALRNWLLSNPDLPEIHNDFLIQLSWADLLSADEIDDLLARYEEEIGVQLKMKQIQNVRQVAPSRTARERYLWRMIAENMSAAYQRELEWVRQVREGLRQEKFIEERNEDGNGNNN